MCINPFHRIDLATCFNQLSHVFSSQSDTCIELQPLCPFGASSLWGMLAHQACKARSEGFFHRPSAWALSSCCFCAILTWRRPFLWCSQCPFWNRYETSRSASTPFFAVLVCFEDRSGCSCVSSEGLSELACDETVIGNDARNSFAVSSVWNSFRFSVFFVCVDISSSRSSSSSPSSADRDGLIVARLGGARSSMMPCCIWASVPVMKSQWLRWCARS